MNPDEYAPADVFTEPEIELQMPSLICARCKLELRDVDEGQCSECGCMKAEAA